MKHLFLLKRIISPSAKRHCQQKNPSKGFKSETCPNFTPDNLPLKYCKNAITNDDNVAAIHCN